MSRRPILRPRFGDKGAGVRTVVAHVGDRFTVATQPPQPGYEHPRTFATYREARGYAGGIRLSRGIPIDDRVAEAER